MRKISASCLGAMCALACGCNLVGNSVHGICSEITRKIDEKRECQRNWELACTVWDDVQAKSGGYSPDYGQGFKEGFVDYLDAGGAGNPPPIPPRRYLAYRYQNPEGYQAINDWFTGFRHGATVAAEIGYRKYIVAPSRLTYPIPMGPDAHSHDVIPVTPVSESRPTFPPSPQLIVPKSIEKKVPTDNSTPPANAIEQSFDILPPLRAIGAAPREADATNGLAELTGAKD